MLMKMNMTTDMRSNQSDIELRFKRDRYNIYAGLFVCAIYDATEKIYIVEACV